MEGGGHRREVECRYGELQPRHCSRDTCWLHDLPKVTTSPSHISFSTLLSTQSPQSVLWCFKELCGRQDQEPEGILLNPKYLQITKEHLSILMLVPSHIISGISGNGKHQNLFDAFSNYPSVSGPWQSVHRSESCDKQLSDFDVQSIFSKVYFCEVYPAYASSKGQ